jgi:IclR family transcriptional regulator, pca regulon regulatory protein
VVVSGLNDVPSKSSENVSTSLERGLAILATFGRQHQALGIAELASQLDMRPSTVHRYVRTLTGLGYLQQDLATRKYRLDFKVVDLGLAVINSLDVRDVARPHLQELSQRTGLTVNMAVLDGPDIVYIERILGRASIDLNLHVGSRQPAYCTSMGKVLLAALDPARLDEALSHTDLINRGRNTITRPDQLKAELATVRQLGFAINNEELAPGLRSVAAPLRNGSGSVPAAINLNGGRHSLNELKGRIASVLLASAENISRQLGAPGRQIRGR